MGDVNNVAVAYLEWIKAMVNKLFILKFHEAEIVSYAIDLKAMTQGSGTFTREFLRYEQVPAHLIDKIIEEYKK